MKQLWKFRPLDTVFFRDSTPFEAGTIAMVQPESRFPPLMHPLQGAIRTSLAIQRGWSPNNGIAFPQELGDADHLGQLSLQGPYLEWMGQILYPLPHVLFGKVQLNQDNTKTWKLHHLVPAEPVDTDLGRQMRLLVPQPYTYEGKTLALWGTKKGLESVLQGSIPNSDQLYSAADLWTSETRDGIERNHETQMVEQGRLYTSVHIRIKHGLKILVWVDGIPVEWKIKKRFATALGGEGRFADVEVIRTAEEPPAFPVLHRDASGNICYTISLLTPGQWPLNELKKVLKEGPAGAPGRCISASIGKLWRVGGWNLAEKRPRFVKPILQPGTTWFFIADPSEEEKIREWHWHKRVGENQDQGMGQLVVGTWREKEDGR
ncbi:type III-B CRISPR module-associated Cmr3 family protein [Laceyella tengchongensis]|jgi:CRISPR-associated protein Cmr3